MSALAVWNDWEDAAIAGVAIVGAYILVLWIAAIVWTYRDISSRATDPFERTSSVLLVALFSLPGLLLHLLMRPPETIEERFDRRLEAEAMFHDIQAHTTCPQCATLIQQDFVVCPVCRVELRSPCGACGEYMALDWVICPFCAAARDVEAARPGRIRHKEMAVASKLAPVAAARSTALAEPGGQRAANPLSG